MFLRPYATGDILLNLNTRDIIFTFVFEESVSFDSFIY